MMESWRLRPGMVPHSRTRSPGLQCGRPYQAMPEAVVPLTSLSGLLLPSCHSFMEPFLGTSFSHGFSSISQLISLELLSAFPSGR